MRQNVLVLFKRDLRVADNPALNMAAGLAADRNARLLPLYIVEPDLWAQADASARQWRFVAESLIQFRDDLAALGAPLIIRMGDSVTILDDLCRAHDIATLISHEETGNGWSFGRDKRIAAWAGANGVDWHEVPQTGITRRLASRDKWAATRQRHMRKGPLVPPKAIKGFALDPGPIPDARDLHLQFDPCPERQKGGRKAGLALIDSFLSERGQTYQRDMSSPIEGAQACSRLSPHLAWGSLSMREVETTLAAHKAALDPHQKDWAKSLRSFQSRLAWRDHFMQKLEDEPALEYKCLHSAYEHLRPKTPDATRLAAWEKGETGVPFVDACMRSLVATGWLNFRMRAMLVSFASYHLWLDWRATGPHLARAFTDFEPGIHWPQMQMQSGTTGMNQIRIYNPVKQGFDQDPTGAFTRKWCPELRHIPDAFLHSPWIWPRARKVLGKSYPMPVVDLTNSLRDARIKVFGVRQTTRFHAEAATLIQKHASRKTKGAGRHFVNDRATLRRNHAKPPQLSFDL